MKIPTTLWELALLTIISGAVGFSIGYQSYASNIENCHEKAEQLTTYGTAAAKAFEFAKCVSPRQYDPLYDYKRFKGK